MDLIRTDRYGNEIAYMQNVDVDFEISSAGDSKSLNDFTVDINRDDWQHGISEGCRVFAPDTEYGGIIGTIETSTAENRISISGYTWRGMMDHKIIRPADGADYATETGELNAIIKARVESSFPGLFIGSDETTGVYVDEFQYDRYCTLHEGLTDLLKSKGYKLDIKYIQGNPNEAGYVAVKAVRIVDYSDDVEFSQDSDFDFTSTQKRNGTNHLICLGSGELAEREVIDLYVDGSGNVGTEQFYFGSDEITDKYDSNGSSTEDLMENGKKKLQEDMNSESYGISISNIDTDIDIGDIVGGSDFITGITIKKPIGRKIWSISAGQEKIEYKLEGDS